MKALARSTIAGFGLSAGRDLYKNAHIIFPVTLMLLGTGYAVYDMYCTQTRSKGTNEAIILGSLLVCALLLCGSTGAAVIAVVIQATSAGVGFWLAHRDRGPILHARALEQANLSFLAAEGFRDVGGRHGTLLDPFNNELVQDDHRDDALVFKVNGRGSVRAYIWLDDEGRMVGYKPPTSDGSRSFDQPTNDAESINNDDFAEESLSHELDDAEAEILVLQLNDNCHDFLNRLVSGADGTRAVMLWSEAQAVTGSRDWSHFARGIIGTVHRKLRQTTGDPEAILIFDSDKFDSDEPSPRFLFIQGPAVSALRRTFELER